MIWPIDPVRAEEKEHGQTQATLQIQATAIYERVLEEVDWLRPTLTVPIWIIDLK
jgi:hypothetical protein